VQESLHIPLRSTWCDAVVNRRRQWSCQECMPVRWLSIDNNLNSVTNNCNMIRPFCGAPPPEKETKGEKGRIRSLTHAPFESQKEDGNVNKSCLGTRVVRPESGPHVIPSLAKQRSSGVRSIWGVNTAAPRTANRRRRRRRRRCVPRKNKKHNNKEHSEEMQGRRLPLVALRVATRRQW